MDPSLSLYPLAPAGPRGVGREGTGQAGISPGSPSWGGAFNRVLPRISPAPSQALGPACVCRGDLGWPAAFHSGPLCLLSLKPGGCSARSLRPASRWAAVGEAAGPKRIGAFLPTLCAALGPPAPRPQRPLVWLPLGAWGSQPTAAPLETGTPCVCSPCDTPGVRRKHCLAWALGARGEIPRVVYWRDRSREGLQPFLHTGAPTPSKAL